MTSCRPFVQVCYDQGLPTLLSLLLSESFFPLLMYFKANPGNNDISPLYILMSISESRAFPCHCSGVIKLIQKIELLAVSYTPYRHGLLAAPGSSMDLVVLMCSTRNTHLIVVSHIFLKKYLFCSSAVSGSRCLHAGFFLVVRRLQSVWIP